MKKKLLGYNLQFFAEEAAQGVEGPEVAAPVESEGEAAGAEESVQDGTEEGTPQSQVVDVDAIAAAARRKAEEEARARQSKIDAEYARRFGNFKNPITGKPIQTQADYLEALDAQSQLQAENQLRQNGVDPAILNQLIASHPTVRQSEAFMEQARKMEAEQQIMSDVAVLSQLDAGIKTFADVPREVVEYSMANNISLVDAFKVCNFGKVATARQEAIQQAAINQFKGKQHMAPVNGISSPETGVDIPASELTMWKDMFPDKSLAELKKLYNETL